MQFKSDKKHVIHIVGLFAVGKVGLTSWGSSESYQPLVGWTRQSNDVHLSLSLSPPNASKEAFTRSSGADSAIQHTARKEYWLADRPEKAQPRHHQY